MHAFATAAVLIGIVYECCTVLHHFVVSSNTLHRATAETDIEGMLKDVEYIDHCQDLPITAAFKKSVLYYWYYAKQLHTQRQTSLLVLPPELFQCFPV